MPWPRASTASQVGVDLSPRTRGRDWTTSSSSPWVTSTGSTATVFMARSPTTKEFEAIYRQNQPAEEAVIF
jgi:hypothetical protein